MKQIKIEQLLPLLKSGWVAYSKDYWYWFDKKPRYDEYMGVWRCRTSVSLNSCFKLKAPKCALKDSLIKVVHKEEE